MVDERPPVDRWECGGVASEALRVASSLACSARAGVPPDAAMAAASPLMRRLTARQCVLVAELLLELRTGARGSVDSRA